MHDEENVLVERAKAGDLNAFGELFERTHRRIYQYIRQMVPTAEDAEDLTQEVYLRAWSGLKSLQASEAFWVWLHRIARNAVLDRGKRARLDSVSLETAYSRDEDDEAESLEIVDWSSNPERVVFTEATQEAVRQAIRSLPEIHREVVTMHHLEGMEVSEIAQVLGVPKNTVLSRLARAREALRRKLSYLVDEK
ncbi:MAG: sigma-70 family RNA polymerase sigma factor [Chthonomonadetes bacterium]|nr:sigma-70 family RNA polymerase sigma factor [Chthonomonadetes bacterium]